MLVEFDRTRRLDKNYDKFRRYDTFLNAWWQHTAFADRDAPPNVLFICADPAQRDLFLHGADHQLTGHHWRPSAGLNDHCHHGRQRILFAIEADAHRGRLQAWRLPDFPPTHPARDNKVRRVYFDRTTAEAGRTELLVPPSA